MGNWFPCTGKNNEDKLDPPYSRERSQKGVTMRSEEIEYEYSDGHISILTSKKGNSKVVQIFNIKADNVAFGDEARVFSKTGQFNLPVNVNYEEFHEVELKQVGSETKQQGGQEGSATSKDIEKDNVTTAHMEGDTVGDHEEEEETLVKTLNPNSDDDEYYASAALASADLDNDGDHAYETIPANKEQLPKMCKTRRDSQSSLEPCYAGYSFSNTSFSWMHNTNESLRSNQYNFSPFERPYFPIRLQGEIEYITEKRDGVEDRDYVNSGVRTDTNEAEDMEADAELFNAYDAQPGHHAVSQTDEMIIPKKNQDDNAICAALGKIDSFGKYGIDKEGHIATVTDCNTEVKLACAGYVNNITTIGIMCMRDVAIQVPKS